MHLPEQPVHTAFRRAALASSQPITSRVSHEGLFPCCCTSGQCSRHQPGTAGAERALYGDGRRQRRPAGGLCLWPRLAADALGRLCAASRASAGSLLSPSAAGLGLGTAAAALSSSTAAAMGLGAPATPGLGAAAKRLSSSAAARRLGPSATVVGEGRQTLRTERGRTAGFCPFAIGQLTMPCRFSGRYRLPAPSGCLGHPTPCQACAGSAGRCRKPKSATPNQHRTCRPSRPKSG